MIQAIYKKGMTNAGNHLDKRCNDPKDRSEFMSHMKCLLPREKMEPFHICVDKNLVMTEKLRGLPKEHMIASSCCIFSYFKECIRKNNKQICADETTDYWDEVFDEIVSVFDFY